MQTQLKAFQIIMDVEEFFELFLDELRRNSRMTSYYKYLQGSVGRFCFRKNYFCARLAYIARKIGPTSNAVWDAGCGFGTTALFLALNGYRVYGTTIETQHTENIETRREYWSQFGDVSGFTLVYRYLWDVSQPLSNVDRIVVQDTLHHLEPIGDALELFRKTLEPAGRLIAIEENGANLVARARLFLQRGTKRIREVPDQVTEKPFLFGDENTRSFRTWERLFQQGGFKIADHEYIRYYLPFNWSNAKYEVLRKREDALWRTSPLRREYFYYGINFEAEMV